MKFAPMKELLALAEEKKIAYGAFVTVSYEMALAAIEAGSELNVPVIFITGTDCIELMGGFEATVETVKRAAANTTVPIALHLDHSEDLDLLKGCIDGGYTSVMYDGSKLPFEQNIAGTKEAVEYAHARGVQVEAELGRLGGREENINVTDYEASLTDPASATEFIEKTGIDSLAVAIGTAHGLYKGTPKLDYERLKEIKRMVDVPLVLHGASDVPDEMIEKAVSCGINKINIATDLKIAFANALRRYLVENTDENDPRKYFSPAMDAVVEVAKHKIGIAGCENKA